MSEVKSFSASKLKTYATCPRLYEYQYILNLLQPASDALVIWTKYHDIVEKFHTWQKHQVDEKYKAVLEWLFAKYVAKPLDWDVVDTEYRFKVEIWDVVIVGIIDRLDTDKIWEYKTTSNDYKQEDVDNWQSDIYIWAMWKTTWINYPLTYHINNKKKINSKKYLPQIITVTKTEEELIEIEKRLLEVIEQINNKNFNPTPWPHCYYCPFGSCSKYAKQTKNCNIIPPTNDKPARHIKRAKR